MSRTHYCHPCPGCGELLICGSVDFLGNHWGDCLDCGPIQLLQVGYERGEAGWLPQPKRRRWSLVLIAWGLIAISSVVLVLVLFAAMN